MKPTSFDVDDDIIPPNAKSRETQDDNLQKETQNNTWNENIRRFATYKATPERMPDRANQQQDSFDSMHVYQDSFDYDEENRHQRNVRFDMPTMPQRKTNYDRNFCPPRTVQFEEQFKTNAKSDQSQYNANIENNMRKHEFQQENVTVHDSPRNESYRQQRVMNITYDIPQQFPNRDLSQQNTHSDCNSAQRNMNFNTPQRNENDYSQRNANIEHDIPRRNLNLISPQRNNMPRNNIQQQSEQNIENTRSSFLRRLRLIPKFSGESFQELKDVIDITETLYFSCINPFEQQELFEHMALQLRGEAKSLVSQLDNFDWPSIKDTLLTYFAYLANKNVLSSQLENLHQEKNESLTEYSERARKLLGEKNAAYNHLTEEQRLEHNRLARRAFSKGIRDSRLRDRMLTRGASSLEDAIAFAIEAENDALVDISRGELFCRYCHLNGHREIECRQKEFTNSNIGKLASALRSTDSNFDRKNWNRNEIQMDYNQNWNNSSSNNDWNNIDIDNSDRNWNNNDGNFNHNDYSNRNGSNFQPNRYNWQQNQRQPQRSNNFIGRARINIIQPDSNDESCNYNVPTNYSLDSNNYNTEN